MAQIEGIESCLVAHIARVCYQVDSHHCGAYDIEDFRLYMIVSGNQQGIFV